MKNSFAFYQGAKGGVNNLAKRLAGAAGGEDRGFMDAAHADAYSAQADLARAKADQEQQQGAALRDPLGWISRLSGATMPQAGRINDYFQQGNFGTVQPLTPNDDEGNPNAPAIMEQAPDDLAPLMDKARMARRLQQVALAGGGNAHQMAQAAGEFQGQGITDAVQTDIGRAALDPLTAASARNQGGKLGTAINLFKPEGSTGAVVNPATGVIDTNNPLAASAIFKNLGEGKAAGNEKAVEGLRAAMTAAGIDPAGPQAMELFKQLATKLVTHPGMVAPNLGHVTDAKGNLLAYDPKAGTTRPVTDAATGAPVVGKNTDIEKALPISAAKGFLENNQNLRKAQTALELIQGFAAGGAKGDPDATGLKGYVPDVILQRTDKKGIETRAAIANLGSMIIHERSGAAVTATEQPRLKPFIPLATDDPATVKKKLAQFVNEYQKILDETAEFYRESGYKVPDHVLRGTGDQPKGGATPQRRSTDQPAAPAGRPALPGVGAPRAVKVSTKSTPAEMDRAQILRDEFAAASARPAATPEEAQRKQADIDSLTRELRALGLAPPGSAPAAAGTPRRVVVDF